MPWSASSRGRGHPLLGTTELRRTSRRVPNRERVMRRTHPATLVIVLVLGAALALGSLR